MKLNTKLIAIVTLLALISIASILPLAYVQPTPQRGPKIDVLRQTVVKSPDSVLIDMIACQLDFAPDLIRPGDAEIFDAEGFTITSAPGFHMGHIGFNIRSDQSYRRDDGLLVGKILSDVWFRFALFKCYDQDTIVASIYKYIVTPIRSLVPKAQGGWLNPAVPRIPFNPGDKNGAGVWPTDDTACGVLRYAGYTYDAGANNWRTPAAWGDEGGQLIPYLGCFTPTYEVAPTSAEHGARWITEVNNIGLTSVTHEPAEFAPYLDKVFNEANFDMYMVFWGLGRFPDHLYDMLHSSQDCAVYPWRYNSPGVNDTALDALLDIIKFSLDHDAKMTAAYEIQERLYDYNYPLSAFCYLQLYSRVYFCAFKPGLRGIVNSPGYGADNSWTYLNIHWESGHPNERIESGKSVFIYNLGEEPELLNPCFSHTVYAWAIAGQVVDGLIEVNPYTHEDLPWLADSWSTETFTGTVTLDSDNRYLGVSAGGTVEVTNGMIVTFNLNSTVEWQDGNLYVPSDAEFNLEFLRNNEIPRYTSMWQHVVDVQVINATAFKVISDLTSQWLLYDFAADAALLPPPVWRHLDGKGQPAILGYDPGANTTTPTGAGPRFGTDACPNQLYGTGPFVYVYYDPIAQYTDMPANRYYFKETAEIEAMKVRIFHNIGDVNRDGEVWGVDKTRYSRSYDYESGESEYDEDADLTGPEGVPDGIVNAWDGVLINFFWGDKKEYP